MNTKYLLWRIKTFLLGNKMFEEIGESAIPCKQCGKEFLSYCHYKDGGVWFDNLCSKCRGN